MEPMPVHAIILYTTINKQNMLWRTGHMSETVASLFVQPIYGTKSVHVWVLLQPIYGTISVHVESSAWTKKTRLS